eukprot:3603149-Rhodomonas_salina.7
MLERHAVVPRAPHLERESERNDRVEAVVQEKRLAEPDCAARVAVVDAALALRAERQVATRRVVALHPERPVRTGDDAKGSGGWGWKEVEGDDGVKKWGRLREGSEKGREVWEKKLQGKGGGAGGRRNRGRVGTVSYTHLTLPTICSV